MNPSAANSAAGQDSGAHARTGQARARWAAGHLPPVFAGQVGTRDLKFGDLTVTVPAPDAAQMQALATHVARATREVLRPLPVSTLITHIDRAVTRLLDPQDPWRRLADDLLPRVTGYDAQMVHMAMNDDEWIAAVTSYVRNSFGNKGALIFPKDVARIANDEQVTEALIENQFGRDAGVTARKNDGFRMLSACEVFSPHEFFVGVEVFSRLKMVVPLFEVREGDLGGNPLGMGGLNRFARC
jgi:hypothetical protein